MKLLEKILKCYRLFFTHAGTAERKRLSKDNRKRVADELKKY